MKEGHNSGVNGGQLRSIVERIERMNAEAKERQIDVKEIYAEAKGNGYCPKTIRQLVRLRAADPQKLEEAEAILDTYKLALGMA
jgi:uncharacterized protein (UPF0335 family)